jgi:acetyl/propionyl-CoA carboxylase alpha subunit
VQAQLRIAAGEPLGLTQADVQTRGHAVECRIYAEDSVRLLPQAGRLLRYREPAGPGLRVDSGVREGLTITGHYDPMLAKLIAHADTREAVFDRVAHALRRFEILGLRHNVAFLLALVERPEVQGGAVDTRFIERHLAELAQSAPPAATAAAAALAAALAVRGPALTPPSSPGSRDPWQTIGPIEW